MTSKKLINIAASIRSRLLNLSKERREDYNYLLILYLGERLLYRLSKSRYQQQFILKGATLFKVWNGEPHRATKDLDFLSSGNNEVEYIEKVFQEICLINCEEDGIIFLSESIKAQVIKEDQQSDAIQSRAGKPRPYRFYNLITVSHSSAYRYIYCLFCFISGQDTRNTRNF
ncbi:MAG: nucleotidyl transferase AbiEii/AbiGii toxin family protein [Aphanizomenon gracile PMC649.10]|nr:nucleotidyl transferase AbiEii/AbiGii toxin family protein [Aphanizomenon gracile PMC649.10]MDM3858301.1 nucleotidyl transferase AbiEii/AbiGii toxin family protein [Aphanizomenon gracile PMC644.10]